MLRLYIVYIEVIVLESLSLNKKLMFINSLTVCKHITQRPKISIFYIKRLFKSL